MTPAILGLFAWISDSALAALFWSALLPGAARNLRADLEYVMLVHFMGTVIIRLVCSALKGTSTEASSPAAFLRGIAATAFLAYMVAGIFLISKEAGGPGLFVGFVLAGVATISRFLLNGMKEDAALNIPAFITIVTAFPAALITGPFGLKSLMMVVWGALCFTGLGVLEINAFLKFRKATGEVGRGA